MKKSILIVDDEFGLADLLELMLTELGYEARIAINGALGLKALSETSVSLVFLDVMMPVLDGVSMAKAMRADTRFRHIPIVMMTSLPEAVPQGEGLYDWLLTKPFTPDELLAILTRFLGPVRE